MKNIFKYIYFLSGLLLVSPVFAQEPPRLTDGTLATLVDKLLSYLFPLAGLICVIFIIQGGYMWMISAGDPARVKQAQGTLTWAVIGFIFVMVIFTVLNAVLDFIAQ